MGSQAEHAQTPLAGFRGRPNTKRDLSGSKLPSCLCTRWPSCRVSSQGSQVGYQGNIPKSIRHVTSCRSCAISMHHLVSLIPAFVGEPASAPVWCHPTISPVEVREFGAWLNASLIWQPEIAEIEKKVNRLQLLGGGSINYLGLKISWFGLINAFCNTS